MQYKQDVPAYLLASTVPARVIVVRVVAKVVAEIVAKVVA